MTITTCAHYSAVSERRDLSTVLFAVDGKNGENPMKSECEFNFVLLSNE